MTGLTLSHYHIDAELGRGGMGIVYKATDTKLNRTVALKVLPAAALSSEDDRARFFREAQAAAQLHHPNIATVFQIDEAIPVDDSGSEVQASDGPRPFIAMEFVEGDTVADLIKKAPFPLSQAVSIAGQVAEALKEAHGKEVVHRDIKSANVMLTPDGIAKVLDFGLAKTNQSTMLTRMGSTLGTVAYMSPEQARGQEVDGRTDLYALGTMLYEMVAGRLPFAGDYEQAVLYSILNEPPEPLTAVRTGVPMDMERVVSKLLSKEAEYRYQSAAGLLADLKSLDLTGSGHSRRSMSSVAAAPAEPSRKAELPIWVWGAVAGALLIGAVGAWLVKPAPTVTSGPVIHAQIDLWPELPRLVGATVSPSGTLFAWSDWEEVHVRNLTSGEQWTIPESNRVIDIKFNDEETWLLFERPRAIDRVQVRAGRPVPFVATGSVTSTPNWAPDGTIVFEDEGDILSIPLSGGTPRFVIPEDSLRYFNDPYLTEDGTVLLVRVAVLQDATRHFGVFEYPSGRQRGILELDGSMPWYVDSGHLVYQTDDGLMAVAVDLNVPELLGAPVPVAEAATMIRTSMTKDGHVFMGSAEGVGAGDLRVLERISWDGTPRATQAAEASYDDFAISPTDPNMVAVEQPAEDGGESIHVLNIGTGENIRLTFGDVGDDPWWHPSGDSVLYVDRSVGTSSQLVLRASDGSGVPRILYAEENARFGYPSASSTFDRVLFSRVADGGDDIWVLDIATGEARPLIVEDEIQTQARFSPDGRFVVYEGNQISGEPRIFMEPFEVDGSRWDLSRGISFDPAWSIDGSAVYFENIDGGISRVLVSTSGGRIGISNPVLVLQTNDDDFEVLPDGSGVLITRSAGSASDAQESPARFVEVIFNWKEELKSLVPVP